MRIKFAEINNLYSYGSEKNRIDFGKKTAIVGANNSGKSVIFKALKYFLGCLTVSSGPSMVPWDRQGMHRITVGLELNKTERRYVAETLAINVTDGHVVRLALDNAVEWLEPRLENIEITIILTDDPYLSTYDQIKYAAYLKGLDATVCSQGWGNTYAWMCKSAKFSPQSGSNKVQLCDVVENLLDAYPNETDIEEMLRHWPEQSMIHPFPAYEHLKNSKTPSRKKIEFLLAMLGRKIPERECSFFTMLGIVLEQRFVFVSEQRRFSKSNDFQRLLLSDDGHNLHAFGLFLPAPAPKRLLLSDGGHNLHGFLYGLHNGDWDEQNTYSEIQKMFSDVMEPQGLSFIVSLVKTETSSKHVKKDKGYAHRVAVQFVEKRGQTQKFTNFMDVGAGVRETLFLLTRCFGHRDDVILLDEPATNLHPTQIRQLMAKILTADARSGQVVVVTHSPALASLEMLSSVNEVVRVDRYEHSRIIQPSGKDRAWIKKNLPTFHLLKSDILFAKKVILVEGNSDKIFLETLLNHGSVYGDDILVVDVGGVRSFKKFRKFLDIFEMPYGILADKDGERQFDPEEILRLSPEATPNAADCTGKKVCILEKNLEHLLKCLAPDIYGDVKKKHATKPERAHEFARRFFVNSAGIGNYPLLEFILEWSKNVNRE